MRLRIDLDQETADALMKAAACDLRSAPSQAEFVLRREYGTLDLIRERIDEIGMPSERQREEARRGDRAAIPA